MQLRQYCNEKNTTKKIKLQRKNDINSTCQTPSPFLHPPCWYGVGMVSARSSNAPLQESFEKNTHPSSRTRSSCSKSFTEREIDSLERLTRQEYNDTRFSFLL